MNDKANELTFQNEIIANLLDDGWVLGTQHGYDAERALYSEDVLAFVQNTQPDEWEKYQELYPNDPEKALLDKVASQLNKADPNATNKTLRTFGTLGVLRHPLKDRSARFSLCQFRPEHGLNPDIQKRYEANILRVVPELTYSPYATVEHFALTGKKAKKWRIDLVLFVNGIPVVTMELKSEFKQSVDNAIRQYKKTRLPKDPETKKPEPLLTFKRGALVHFAVSQYEVYMATKLAGGDTFFLPFNKGTLEQGAGNDVPKNPDEFATGYLWREVLQRDHLLQILGRFIHLEIKDAEDWDGCKYKKETMIFPRFHQWSVVSKLITTAKAEGPGHRYLVQHSAGSGKSNSIAWTAHQLSGLYNEQGHKVFDSVIVITDRTVLDNQLQDTISQIEHTDGIVLGINRNEGQGSKSEQLAGALEQGQPIIIVTIQTFPFVIQAIENSVALKEKNYAIIADEAHSSQSGSTARKLKEVLQIDGEESDDELSADDTIQKIVESRKASTNLSYFAFTATPKSKTLELFGRLPSPDEPASKTNKPMAFHVYSMRQAIEEGFILDVLKNYTNYRTAYQLSLKVDDDDTDVESKRAKVKLNQWVRLHDYNIAQKAQVIVEHFRDNIMGLLNGQAKAMVVASSRKEAVRYKLAFDNYIKDQKYVNLHCMVAFSGDVEFAATDPNATKLIAEKFNEKSMNPGLKGREMRKAFDTDEYQVMIVANKFQTGFDQPKLCAMYVDKKLGGVECVQTLSRLNRTFPGKEQTYVLDFFNDPQEVLESFLPFYKTAELLDVSDPNMIFDLFEKLKTVGIFTWQEVEQFVEAFFQKNKSQAAIANICKPAVDRWKSRYVTASTEYQSAKQELELAKQAKQPVLVANSEKRFKEAKQARDKLDIFKKDLGTYVRFYEFMSQIVDYDCADLEKLSEYARNLRPLLREVKDEDDDMDLSNVQMTHYRLSKLTQQHLVMEGKEDEGLKPYEGGGVGQYMDTEEERLSVILARLNEIFLDDGLTEADLINYAFTVRDKIRENQTVMHQIANNTDEQAMLGDFPKAIDDAILETREANQKQTFHLLKDDNKLKRFAKVVFDLVKDIA